MTDVFLLTSAPDLPVCPGAADRAEDLTDCSAFESGMALFGSGGSGALCPLLSEDWN